MGSGDRDYAVRYTYNIARIYNYATSRKMDGTLKDKSKLYDTFRVYM